MNVPVDDIIILSVRPGVKRLTLFDISHGSVLRISSLQSVANEVRLVTWSPRGWDVVRGASLVPSECVQTSRSTRLRTWLPVTWYDRSRRTGSQTAGITAPAQVCIWAWLGTTSDGVMLQWLHQQWWWAHHRHHHRQHRRRHSSARWINIMHSDTALSLSYHPISNFR